VSSLDLARPDAVPAAAGVPPTALGLAPTALTVHWHDRAQALPAALLRAHCRCAACVAAIRRGEAPARDPALTLVDAIPVGHYAVQLRFSDGHERGIYPWDYLRTLAESPDSARV
jgi:DUF971 family protein